MCIAKILPYLRLDEIQHVVLPFALETTSDAANNEGTVYMSGDAQIPIHHDTDHQRSEPSYILEFDFFLSEGETVIAMCCTFSCYLGQIILLSYSDGSNIRSSEFVCSNMRVAGYLHVKA